MSSGCGDTVSTDDEADKTLSSQTDEVSSKDQIDHSTDPSLGKDDLKLQTNLTSADANKTTDSCFEDITEITDRKSNSENTDDNSDEDLELKWDDDDNEEQNDTPQDNVKEASVNVLEAAKPLDSEGDTNLSSTDVVDDKAEDIDENKLLESSSSNSEDTSPCSTSDSVKNVSPINKTESIVVSKEKESIVSSEPISEEIEDMINETELLEGPESDNVDEEKLLEDSDERREVTSSQKDNTVETNTIEIPAVTKKLEDNPPNSSPHKSQDNDSEMPAKESIGIEKLESYSTKSVMNESTTKVISDLENASQTALSTSSPNSSLIVNTEHGLKKPDMMLEIPTQEIIELMDDTEVSIAGIDETMEVDDESATTALEVTDKDMEVEIPELKQKDDAIMLKPADTFRTLESATKDSSQKIKDVSEDDWCEIERRLEGFEHSFEIPKVKNSEFKELSDNMKEAQKKSDDSDIVPLTQAQKNVIETENKELLKTLQETSKVDSTFDQTFCLMDDEDESSTSNIEDQSTTLESPVKSPECCDNNDSTPESVLPSDLYKTQKISSINYEEHNLTMASENIVQESNKLENKTDNIINKSLSPLKSVDSKEEQADETKEHTIQDIEVSDNADLTSEQDIVSIEKELPDIEKSKDAEEVHREDPKEPEVQSSTNLPDKDVLPSYDKPLEAMSPKKCNKNDTSIELSCNDKSDTITLKHENKIDNKQADEIKDDEVVALTSVSIDKDVDIVKELTSGSETSKDNDSLSTVKIPSNSQEKVSNDAQSVVAADNDLSTPKTSNKIEVQASTSTNDVEKLTEKVLSTLLEVIPSTSKENAVPSATKITKKIKEQPTTSTMEVEKSTEKDLSTPIEGLAATSKISDEIKEQPSISTMELEKSTEKVLSTPIEVLPSTSKVAELPSSSKTPNKLEVQPTTSTMEVDKSTEKVLLTPIEVLPSTSKDESLPSTSKSFITEIQPSKSELSPSKVTEIDAKPSTSTDIPSTSLDPDSDEVPEMSDSLGLLAESSRVMEDDEDQDDEDEGDGEGDAEGDDDEDYDPEDESSNQMTAEHSEDSNAPHSETDAPKDQDEKDIDIESPTVGKGQSEFDFTIGEVVSEKDKDGASVDKGKEKDGDMEVDEEIGRDDVEVSTEKDSEETTKKDVEATETNQEKKGEEKEETAKSTDEAAMETAETKTDDFPVLRNLLVITEKEDAEKPSDGKSPSKKLVFAQPENAMNIVDLEGSSSEDDIQEVKKKDSTESGSVIALGDCTVTIPSAVEVTSVPAEQPTDVGSEVTVGSREKEEAAAKTDSKPPEDKPKPKFSLEIFSLDSDEEDNATAPANTDSTADDKPKEPNRCINICCKSNGGGPYYAADAATVAYFDAGKKKKAVVCQACADIFDDRTKTLIKGIRELTPLLALDGGKLSSELVEISDSESEDEADAPREPGDVLGTGKSFLEANLAKMINETWTKFCMDSRLKDAQDDLTKEMDKLEAESKEIDAMLTECQVATDKLRNELYATFETKKHETTAIIIYDTPMSKYTCLESLQENYENVPETRAKRRMSAANETPAKRPAIPLGYAPLDAESAQVTQDSKSAPTVENNKAEDDKDISVLKVSAELAPPDLPPPGELVRPPLRAGMCVYAMRNAIGSWVRSRVIDVTGKTAVQGSTLPFTVCRVKYEHKPKSSTKLFPARCLAYAEPASVRLTIGTRVIALVKDAEISNKKDAENPMKKDAFYSGIIAEVPNPVNNYRYLVFFDDGYAQYARHRETRVVCECSSLVWEEVQPYSREFVREYLIAYPERPMVRLHAGQSLKTEWNGKWWTSRVIQVDASLAQIHFEEDNRTEWIYRGSTRLAPLFLELQAAERHRARPMPRTKAQPRMNMPYVEYTRSDEQNKTEQPAVAAPAPAPPVNEREIRQRAVAKKSTAMPPAAPSVPPPSADNVTSRVVYYTPKNAVKPYKMATHTCGPQCKRKDVLALKDLRTYNPLAKPLLSGWERQIVRFKGHKEVMYRAPCGRRLRNMRELHRYLRVTHSDMAVDLFDFTPHTHCLAEFVLNKCLVGKKDLSHGKENVPVPCVNYYDESLPEFCSYNTERTPTAGVPLNLDPEFLCGCDCTDDCEDKSKCACWQMTLEGARTIGLEGPHVGYEYKRLPDPLPSGIYECNSRCKCKHTCLNRVAQHPLQLKLQVFKTLNRGWGIRALNDVPKGSFLCVYAGNLLTDATANMDGLNEGDEYLAELDYIEVVEQMKEGYEEDIPEADKRLDRKNIAKVVEEPAMSSSDEDATPSKDEQEDGDFCPGYIGMGVSEFSKHLRKRDKSKKKIKEEGAVAEKKEGEKPDDDFITISDDEEIREPSRFMAQASMGKEFISKYRSVRTYFGKDEACYIMDAKVQGNIGRYLNHSCQPNVFVQNVFVDTHDPRFPWVAFFALSHIKAGTELTWNYNYDVGSVPGKVLYCYCGAPNCRGRLL